MSEKPYSRSGGSLLLDVHAQPGAKREGAVGLHGGALKIALQAPPVEGKANKALLAYLAQALGLRKSEIEIVSGESSRKKRLRLPASAEGKLRALIGEAGE